MQGKLSRPHRCALLAALAAVVATCGDLLMLYVVNARRPELGLAVPPSATLALGYYLGVLGIPVYAAGYWGVSRALLPASRQLAKVFLLSGVVAAVLGGTLHGTTGLSIEAGFRAGSPPREPLGAILDWGVYMLPLWGAAALLVIAGSSAYALAVARGRSAFPRWMSAINPVTLTLAVAFLGVPSVLLQSFLVPAAPNVAHVLFFGFAGVSMRRDLVPAA